MHRWLIAGLLAFWLAPAARAQEISEEKYLSVLSDDHVALRSLQEGIARAEAERARARTLSNPRLDFWRESPDNNPEVTNWTLAWTPPLDGRYGLGKKAAEAGLAAAKDRFAVDRAAVRREFRKAFAEWSLAFEARSVLRQQLDLVAGLAEHERQRARAGEESGLSARRFSLAEGELKTVLGTAEAAYVRAAAVARALNQELAEDARPVSGDLPEPPADFDVGNTPQLKALEHEREQADYGSRRAGRFVGFPTILFGWQTLEDRNLDDSGPIVAAGWAIPILDRDQGARVEARYRKDIVAAQLAFESARLKGKVVGGVEAYRELRTSALAASETAADTDKIIAAATAAFRAGETDLTDLLETLRAAFTAKLRALEMHGQALEAHRDLEEALGRPLAEGDIR